MKIFRLMIYLLFVISVVWLSGCEKIMDMGMTDGMVSLSDSETMPTLKVGLIHPQPNYTGLAKGRNSLKPKLTMPAVFSECMWNLSIKKRKQKPLLSQQEN